jgi:peptide/nickel transport system permease protein
MIRYIAARLAIVAVSLLGLITLSFLLVSLIPGDPAKLILGDYATPESIAQVHKELGLDKPLPERYLAYVGQTLQGDLGSSYFTHQPVRHDLLMRVPNTLVLLLPGVILGLALGLTVGSLGAYYRRRLPDRFVGGWITTSQAIPEFVIGLLLIYVFFFALGLAPAPVGMLDAAVVRPENITGSEPLDALLTGQWATLQNIFAHAVLPIVTIGIFLATYFAKTARTGLSQSLRSPQVEFARACGLRERKVFGYALTAVRTSLLTYVVILFGASLGGAAIIEVLFAWPGVGNWSLQGVLKGDVPVIQGFVLIMGVATLLAYVVLDIVVVLLDPRARPR